MTLPPPATTPVALRRTPELAAYGYLLDKCDETVSDMWLVAVEHLRGREIYPADRQSFIFNPIEILGIAVGLANVEKPMSSANGSPTQLQGA